MEKKLKELLNRYNITIPENCEEVVYYIDGFLPNSYKWPAPGKSLCWHRRDGFETVSHEKYDRKRSQKKFCHLLRFKTAKGGDLRIL